MSTSIKSLKKGVSQRCLSESSEGQIHTEGLGTSFSEEPQFSLGYFVARNPERSDNSDSKIDTKK